MSVEEERTLTGTQIVLRFSAFSPAALDHLEPVCCIGWKTEAHLKCSELLGVTCRILPAKLLSGCSRGERERGRRRVESGQGVPQGLGRGTVLQQR